MAEAGQEVCVIERGRPYPPGSFPRSPYQMRDNFWSPQDDKYGLYDVWSFRHIASIVSAGLGGGSLIYANVLIRKDERWFVHDSAPGGGHEDWPVTRAELEPHYDVVEKILEPQRYPFEQSPYDATPKTIALQQAAEARGLEWFLPNLAVTFANDGRPAVPGELISEAHRNLHDRDRYTCRLVGECDVGCNYGSKNSLDYNYLSAAKRLGADIRTNCEVKTLRPLEVGGFEITYTRHTSDRERPNHDRAREATVTCDKLVLSAGTFGSNYLLLKNKSSFPGLSHKLGTGFSGNGDYLGLVFRATDASGRPRVVDPNFGPVITSTVRADDDVDGGSGRGFYIQDAGYPALLSWLIEVSQVPSEAKRALRFAWHRWKASRSTDPVSRIGHEVRDFLGGCDLSKSSMPLLGMGRDVAGGSMHLTPGGALDLDWMEKKSNAYFDRVRETMRGLAASLNGTFRDDPVWYLRKYLVTVHPLGGIPMGVDDKTGVVDSYGQVFGYPGFHVADGSVMPGPVGPNPSLTIAALADRGAIHLIETGN